jgi:metal-dependent amidase/aminoacylase/carboxypeptidase family protein
MPIVTRIADLHAEITAWRHDLHAHPELRYDVHRTADLVAARLTAQGAPLQGVLRWGRELEPRRARHRPR